MRPRDQLSLALVQVVDQAQLADSAMIPFKLLHETGEDPDHGAALGQGAVGQPAHRTDRASAVNDRNGVAGEQASKSRGCIEILGFGLGAG